MAVATLTPQPQDHGQPFLAQNVASYTEAYHSVAMLKAAFLEIILLEFIKMENIIHVSSSLLPPTSAGRYCFLQLPKVHS
jgi:hypothetical protein